MVQRKRYYEARYIEGSCKLADYGESLSDMKEKIDESNKKAVSGGWNAKQFQIVMIDVVTVFLDNGHFKKRQTFEEAIEIYPSQLPKRERWVYNDGGRSNYFKAEKVGDCVARAIAIGTGKDYKEVYDALNKLAKQERTSMKKQGVSNARNGVYKETFKKYLEGLGWVWHPTMQIGQGCKVHLNAEELPKGTIIVSVSKHLTCMIDGVINDTYDCSREGTRCVYGYYTKR